MEHSQIAYQSIFTKHLKQDAQPPSYLIEHSTTVVVVLPSCHDADGTP